MNDFKDFKIKTTATAFTGKSIEMQDIIGKKIIVSAFRIDPSKFPEKGNGMRLTLQIEFDGEQRIVFSGSIYLQEMIKQVPAFPFSATIIKHRESRRLEFS